MRDVVKNVRVCVGNVGIGESNALARTHGTDGLFTGRRSALQDIDCVCIHMAVHPGAIVMGSSIFGGRAVYGCEFISALAKGGLWWPLVGRMRVWS